MTKTQINVRLSAHGIKLLQVLTERLSARSLAEAGRPTTQAEVIERALRHLHQAEGAEKKSARPA